MPLLQLIRIGGIVELGFNTHVKLVSLRHIVQEGGTHELGIVTCKVNNSKGKTSSSGNSSFDCHRHVVGIGIGCNGTIVYRSSWSVSQRNKQTICNCLVAQWKLLLLTS